LRDKIDKSDLPDAMAEDKADWLESMDYIHQAYGDDGVRELMNALQDDVRSRNIPVNEARLNTPYVNTIAVAEQPRYPGDLALEKRIENINRWNAMAMVLQAQDAGTGVGGHIATYASAATMMEVGFNYFFTAASETYGGDIISPQPHAAPGVYARAFLEGRLSEDQLAAFRRQLQPGGGLSSYPHPRAMPDFWQMPNASMGLSTATAIYQARFARYLENRGLKPANGGKIWCFIGDGESDEPEVLGTISIASREKLDNIILVVNCNLQRLDGPVRGNGKIIQELERSFRGADWQVLKVIWGSGWDGLLAEDHDGLLRKRMEEAVDGDYQYYSVSPGDIQREHWIEGNPQLEKMMNSLSDDELRAIKRGGQDPKKIYAAFKRAVETTGKPTVILVKTVKGDGMGASLQGRNTAHQKKNLNREERIARAIEYGIPISTDEAAAARFYTPPADSDEMRYIAARRQALGAFLPSREVNCEPLTAPALELFSEAVKGSGERTTSTTAAMVRMLAKLMRDKDLGKYVVPIVPDEARTFGMDGLFSIAGIYSPEGQNYTPVDAGSLVAYREAVDGQILQEGICETGALASFLAAGTAYAVHGLPMIPFYVFYSMFGFQRVGDMIWSAGDMFTRGFLLGGTAGRTTLNGEGLQHQDGHSQIVASTLPNLKSYDPAYAYELAIIIREGIRRMYEQQEDLFYYLTLYNETYAMPALPDVENLQAGVLKGGYLLSQFNQAADVRVNLLASGCILQQAVQGASLLEELGYGVNIYSITSFNELYRDAIAVERARMLAPASQHPMPYIVEMLQDSGDVTIAVTDYMKSLANSIGQWVPGRFHALGTDGYGVCDSRGDLRDYFEINPKYVVKAALSCLLQEGKIDASRCREDTAMLESLIIEQYEACAGV
jgi:pyruvate dehydrogenase E1 component